ncbi:hypothetical protein AB6A40_009258 [Gnathostoma spinigerum]|uniref:SGF29 C-terminal domain-containing protein n=1 Tax=Gnathostoma spinigerum TaxID=75299 RepID=A0ABD6EZ55_9BILA
MICRGNILLFFFRSDSICQRFAVGHLMPPRSGRRLSNQQKKDEDEKRQFTQSVREKAKLMVPMKNEVNKCLANLQSFYDKNKLSIGCKVSGQMRSKLIALHTRALEALEAEEKFQRGLMDDIERFRKLRSEVRKDSRLDCGSLMERLSYRARTLPLWIGPVDSYPPPLVGGIAAPDDTPVKEGAFVAALISGVWILAEVISVHSTNKYEVKDVDGEQNVKVVAKSRLIQLPCWRADPLRDSHALFPRNAIVLALYPQTTCFYKGAVERAPRTADEDYLIAFEDSTYKTGYSPPFSVPQRYVLTHKKNLGYGSDGLPKVRK